MEPSVLLRAARDHISWPTMEDSPILMASSLILPLLLSYPLLSRAFGLPPLPSVVRTVRPYAPLVVCSAWAYYRLLSGGGGDDGSRRSAAPGLLSLWVHSLRLFELSVRALRRLSTVAAQQSSDPSSSSSPDEDTAWRLTKFVALLLNDVLGYLLLKSVLSTLRSLRKFSLREYKASLIQSLFEFAAENVPPVKRKLAEEEAKMVRQIETEVKDPDRTVTRALPPKGWDRTELLEEMRRRKKDEDDKWKDGLVSGTVYSGEEEHGALMTEAYGLYSWSNPLHADVWPSVNQYEAEVISMTASLLGGEGKDSTVVGSMTSGGTESIVLAVRSALRYFGVRRGVYNPEIVCGTTAHAGLDKACEMMGIRLIKLDVDPRTFQLKPRDVERAMTADTILVYASAPNFPQGVIDPVEELASVASRFGVGLHVDACLGGFVLPFARRLGENEYGVPGFDFGCHEGVTSMSVDTHKYGYATKGTSVVLYRNKALRRAQYFAYPHWTGGLYATPTIAGSRAGGLLACAWASMMVLGEEGYLSRTRSIMDATLKVARGVERIEGLRLMGEGMPKATVVCFGSSDDALDIYRVGDVLTKKGGWSLNSLQRPPCIHLCVTLQTVPHVEKFVKELERAVEEVRREGDAKKAGGNAAVYGLAGSLPPGPVASLLECYTDAMLTP